MRFTFSEAQLHYVTFDSKERLCSMYPHIRRNHRACEWIRAMTEKANQEFGQCMQKLSVNEKKMYDETTVQRTERHSVIEIYFLIDCM